MSRYTSIFLMTLAIFTDYAIGTDPNCVANGPERCIVPQFADYTALGPEGGILKLINDSLRVPCDKVVNITSCIKNHFPACSYTDVFAGASPFPPDPHGVNIPGGLADQAIDMIINYICVKEFYVFNEAKVCLASRMQNIQTKLEDKSCDMKPTNTRPEGLLLMEKKLCSNVDTTPFECLFDTVGEVCGKPVIDKTKALVRRLCELTQNIAYAKSTAQSSTWDETSGSSKAVDGNPNPDYYVGKSCSHTLYDEFAWWSVDIGCNARIDTVIITNRGDNQLGHRLHDFNVGVSDKDPRVTAPRPSNYKLCGTFTGPAGDGATLPITCTSKSWDVKYNTGRYVIIQLPSSRNYLHICEVVVRGECTATYDRLLENVAYGKKTMQSSTYRTGVSFKAVDGNANPDYSIGSCMHTEDEANAWWAVDLGCTAYIRNISITNRGDRSLGRRLHDFNIGLTSTNPLITSPRPSNYKICATHKGTVKDGATLTFTCNQEITIGRYVVIQMPGDAKNILHICEAVINGKCNSVNIGNSR